MSPHAHDLVEWGARWVVPILLVFLIPLFSVAYVWDHNAKVRQYDASVAACERGNVLRVRINAKFAVYDRAFSRSAKALEGATTAVGRELHRVQEAAATTATDPIPLTDCMAAYESPLWFWQRRG